MVVLPAPDGPTSAVSLPGRRVERDVAQHVLAGVGRSGAGSAIDSSEASDTSEASG